jgi:hypothetical protein
MLAPLGQVFFISFRINNLSASTAWTLFLAASPTDANRTSSPCAPRAPMSAKAARTPLPIGADEVTALDRTAAYAKGPACRTFTGISLTICSGYPVLRRASRDGCATGPRPAPGGGRCARRKNPRS